jgi:hypothetical protein
MLDIWRKHGSPWVEPGLDAENLTRKRSNTSIYRLHQRDSILNRVCKTRPESELSLSMFLSVHGWDEEVCAWTARHKNSSIDLPSDSSRLVCSDFIGCDAATVVRPSWDSIIAVTSFRVLTHKYHHPLAFAYGQRQCSLSIAVGLVARKNPKASHQIRFTSNRASPACL